MVLIVLPFKLFVFIFLLLIHDMYQLCVCWLLRDLRAIDKFRVLFPFLYHLAFYLSSTIQNKYIHN